MLSAIEQWLQAVDQFQQRHRVLAFPVAVWMKFNDDQAGNLATLISYYGFAAIFPMLLVFVTVLNIVLKDDPSLQANLLNSAVSQYPVIGPMIRSNLGSISSTGYPLSIGIVFLLFGARGVAIAMQNALCTVWDIPKERRPKFPVAQLWAMLLLIAIGLCFVATTFLSSVAGGVGQLINGAAAHVGAVGVSLILNIGMFWLSFRIATVRLVPWRNLRTGAIIAAICWQTLQVTGGYLISHQLHRASELYGTFGIVLGLLTWLFLQAEVTLYAAEIDVVLTRCLWPCSLSSGEPTTASGAATAQDSVSPGEQSPQTSPTQAGTTLHSADIGAQDRADGSSGQPGESPPNDRKAESSV
jgi:membrane protein